MSQPTDLVLHGDARQEAISILQAGLTGRAESYVTGVTVAGRYNGTPPFIAVVSDGVTGGTWPVVDRESVRVNVWHSTEADAHDLARLARALLLLGTSGQLVNCLPGTGPFDTLDDQDATPLSWFTVDANMHGEPDLAS